MNGIYPPNFFKARQSYGQKFRLNAKTFTSKISNAKIVIPRHLIIKCSNMSRYFQNFPPSACTYNESHIFMNDKDETDEIEVEIGEPDDDLDDNPGQGGVDEDDDHGHVGDNAFQVVLPPCGGKRERAGRGKMDNRLEKINLSEEAQVDEERYLFK